MKITYFGYDFFYTSLQAIMDAGHEVIQIYTYHTDNKYNFNHYIRRIADDHNIPVSFDKPTKKEIENLFTQRNCEMLIVGAYPYIIPVPDISSFRGINIHPTLLPKGRGEWPLPYIIYHNHKTSGVTLHKITKELDAGDILLQEKFTLHQNEDLETLSCRSQILAEKLIVPCLENIEKYWKNAVPQTHGSEYWEYPSEEMMTFNGNMCIADIDRKIRAFGKFDSCVNIQGKNYLVHDANCWVENHNYSPNEVVHITNKEILLAAIDGFVCIRFFEEETA